ncbi:MAG: SpvB/TcaC N-terminal domain-containing protein [Acidobacteriota bacterium]|nr:SpvB/TcaC N-terminal domain-containing protein [Acidobacteriota bacterium]
MSLQRESPAELIALPQGGGALQGIGEKFSPDLFTGTGNLSVPITLPAGRNGFQPQLSLTYSSGHGQGPFGLGWRLSLPGIRRKTSKGVPRYDDQRDVFLLSGAEDLVEVGRAGGVATYRPRTEGLFARVEHHRKPGSDFWRVRSKDGLISDYGTEPPTGEGEGHGRDPGVVTDPTDPERIFAWRLTRTVDPFGNRIVYEYERDSGEGDRLWDQLYLRRIRYVDYGAASEERYLVSVTFDYDHERPDPLSDRRPGFELRTRWRCRAIEVRTHAESERHVRTYGLTYLDETEVSADRLPANGTSLLSRIAVTGHDGDLSEALPPLEFGYSRFEPQAREFLTLASAELPARSLADPHLELVDLFGNGLPDFLEMGPTVRYWRNLGGGRFDFPRPMRDAPAGLSFAQPGIRIIDADGDGRADLLVATGERAGYYPLASSGTWDRRSFRRYRTAPTFSLEDPEVRLVDLDGDGVTDAVRSGSSLECYFNDPERGWHATRRVERRRLEEFPNLSFSDPRVRWADMTGDGLQDIVLIHDGSVEVWPSLGRGDWAPRVSMQKSPRFPAGYDPARILLGDVDGDGLADLVYVSDTRVTLWINRGGLGWSEPIEIRGTPPVSDRDSVRLIDLLGTGIAGILWSREAGLELRGRSYFLDFTGGVKPYLLTAMNNHSGAVTRVEYQPSTRSYLADQERGLAWRTPLPFPVQVVARVEAADQLSGGKLTTEYSYHHGYWDGEEREFRGFGRVDQRDSEEFERYGTSGLHPGGGFQTVPTERFSPPVETRTWFHQGAVAGEAGGWTEQDFTTEYWSEDPKLLSRPPNQERALRSLPPPTRRDALRSLRGRILRSELYALDGGELEDRPYTVTEHLYGVREEVPPQAGDPGRRRVFFPHVLEERETRWERGEDPATRFTLTADYDPFGQPRRVLEIACPRGWRRPGDRPAGRYLATCTLTRYAEPAEGSPAAALERHIRDRISMTTRFDIVDEGGFSLEEIVERGRLQEGLRPLAQTLNFYDGEPFHGLPLGRVGRWGALVRTEELVLAEGMLRRVGEAAGFEGLAPYLFAGEASPDEIAWSVDYPTEFRARLPRAAGYVVHSEDDGCLAGCFARTERRCYDVQAAADGPGRGLVTAHLDPLAGEAAGAVAPTTATRISYDSYDLLPVVVVDAAGLRTEADYDYRVLQPRQVTDPNGNRKVFGFTPLGLLSSIAVQGKEGEAVGDGDHPSTVLRYDLSAFSPVGRPISVTTVRREHHHHDEGVSGEDRQRTLTTVEYSDGFGRPLQARTQAEDVLFGEGPLGQGSLPPVDGGNEACRRTLSGRRRGPGESDNVLVSGWQIYDNKGRVVRKYEPFFDHGWEYQPLGEETPGASVVMEYDPLGRVIRTVNPQGSEERVVYGRPPDLTDPALFRPSPWEVFAYDANDNGGRTHGDGALEFRHSWNTPRSTTLDALGRPVETIERLTSKPEAGAAVTVQELSTVTTYNLQGHPVEVQDALGHIVFRYLYDLAGRKLCTESLDAGVRWSIFDAAGNEIERRDPRGALILRSYDALQRPVRLWARDSGAREITLREVLIYGDDPQAEPQRSPAELNLLGRLYQHYDEAGRLTFEAYDFKGNVVEKTRQVLSDEAILAVYPSATTEPGGRTDALRVHWQPRPGESLEERARRLLDPAEHRLSSTYDALDRVTTTLYPLDADGERKRLEPRYNRAGALEALSLAGEPFVERIAYNARGQRILLVYGNGVMTRYAYDPETFRLVRLRSERLQSEGDAAYVPSGSQSDPATLFQDLAYRYDLGGNLLEIQDRAPRCGVLDNPQSLEVQGHDPELARRLVQGDALLRRFEYDSLDRLLRATGREHAAPPPPPPPPWTDRSPGTDLTRARLYTESYTYDGAGNLTRLKHGSVVRSFTLQPGLNRLQSLKVDGETYSYAYDANGNLTREGLSRHFEWDHSDRLRAFRNQMQGAEPSVHAHYLYDGSGERVKKLVRTSSGGHRSTVYVDGLFEHHRKVSGGSITENDTLHVLDGHQRIAVRRVGPPFSGDPSEPVQYHLGDHLGNSHVTVAGPGGGVVREEYTPYGETSFGGFVGKRFRFSGKERDEESGFCYYGARYYAPWLARWFSNDPEGSSSGSAGYRYAVNNPLRFVDPDGRKDREAILNTGPQGQGILSFVPGQVPGPTLRRWDGPGLAPTPRDRAVMEGRLPREDSEEGFLYDLELKKAMKSAWGASKVTPSVSSPSIPPSGQFLSSKELDASVAQAESRGNSIVYLRIDLSAGYFYVGRSGTDLGFGRFNVRQAEHGSGYSFLVLATVKGSLARVVEEDWIRRFGGPSIYGGYLENKRYEMNESIYRSTCQAIGREPIPRPTENRGLPNPPRPLWHPVTGGLRRLGTPRINLLPRAPRVPLK